MTAIYRVTVYGTKGGVRRPDDHVIWTRTMTEDEYERWQEEREAEIDRARKTNA
jgi:hypothetical protein